MTSLRSASVLLGIVLVLGSQTQAASPPRTASPVPLDEIRTFAQNHGFTGEDLTPLLRSDLAASHRPSWVVRPSGRSIEVRLTDPALRVHVPIAFAAALRDADLDGVVDRAQTTLRTAARTLVRMRQLGLGAPLDDGDGEIDLYLLPLEGISPGFTVFETRALAGRGASGFAVIDGSPQQSEEAIAASTARAVARLTFGALDVEAPTWWLEPSVSWIQAEVTGPSLELERALQIRWNHPERGIDTSDPLLARGNFALIAGLQDPRLEARLLASSWSRLAGRDEGATPLGAVEEGVLQSVGGTLMALQLRAAVSVLADGLQPSRYGVTVQSLPLLEQDAALPLAPLGISLVSISPDPREPHTTVLSFTAAEKGWVGSLLAHRPRGGWDLVPLRFDGLAPASVTLPWSDYDRAVAMVARPPNTPGAAALRVRAESLGPSGLFALSSVGSRLVGHDLVELFWSTAWENNLYGWIVERGATSEGPWEPTTMVPVPAVGSPHHETQYALQDLLPSRGAHWYYRVVGLTVEGLRVSGPIVALSTSF